MGACIHIQIKADSANVQKPQFTIEEMYLKIYTFSILSINLKGLKVCIRINNVMIVKLIDLKYKSLLLKQINTFL